MTWLNEINKPYMKVIGAYTLYGVSWVAIDATSLSVGTPAVNFALDTVASGNGIVAAQGDIPGHGEVGLILATKSESTAQAAVQAAAAAGSPAGILWPPYGGWAP